MCPTNIYGAFFTFLSSICPLERAAAITVCATSSCICSRPGFRSVICILPFCSMLCQAKKRNLQKIGRNGAMHRTLRLSSCCSVLLVVLAFGCCSVLLFFTILPLRNIPERIRTSNLWLRRPTLYPIELRGQDYISRHIINTHQRRLQRNFCHNPRKLAHRRIEDLRYIL